MPGWGGGGGGNFSWSQLLSGYHEGLLVRGDNCMKLRDWTVPITERQWKTEIFFPRKL
jgi:hypothetical protein